MSDLATIVKNSIEQQEETVDVVIISLRDEIISSLITMLLTLEKCRRIVIPVAYTKLDLTKYTGKIINTRSFGSDPGRCIFFGDFEGTHFLTSSQFDYFEKVDRVSTYRRYCKFVIMYDFIGTPPANGYWVFDPEREHEFNSPPIFFLKLSLWGQLCQSLQILNNSEPGYVRLECVDVTKEWLEKLKTILRHFLPEILSTDEYTEELLSDENMICWVRGFVNETYNYIYNYNGLEFVGDGIFEAALRTFMFSKYPRLQAGEATNYRTEYASRDYMSIWASDMQLVGMILADPDAFKHNTKTKGDLFESFFAALFNTCTNIDISLGYIACQNLMTMIGETLTFEKKIGFGRPQHRVEQMLASYGLEQGKVNPTTGKLYSENADFGVRFIEPSNGIPIGTKGTRNQYVFAFSQRFYQFVTNIQKDKPTFVKILAPFEYDPLEYDKTQQWAKTEFWTRIANIFQECGIDMEYIKKQKQLQGNFLDEMVLFDPITAQEAKNKLAVITGKTQEEATRLVQFKFNKDDGYIIMWIHTEELVPESKLLSSLTSFSGGSSVLSDDYYNPMTNFYQIRNLAVVPFPQVGEYVNGNKLDTKKLGMYNAILKFTRS